MNIVKRNSLFIENLKKHKVLFLMLLPALVFVIIFSYLPLGALLLAFKNYNYSDGIMFSPWAGLDNFKYFYVSGKLFLLLKNTVMYNLIFIAVNQSIQIILAVFLAEMLGKKMKKLMQSLMFLPYFVSWVVVGALSFYLFNYEYGAINSVLSIFGIAPVDFYSTRWLWYIILPLFNIWKYVGYGCVLYLAAIMGLDAECFEYAKIDGANVFQKIWYITVPMLKPTVIILILLQIGRILRGDFELFYQIVGKAPFLYDVTDVVDTFVFRALTEVSDIGMTAAATFMQSVLCFVIIVIVNAVIKRVDPESSLF